MNTIKTLNSLVSLLSDAKENSKCITMECTTSVKLNKYPTDGTERVRIHDSFNPQKHYSVSFSLDETYEQRMCEALETDTYHAQSDNTLHIIPNLLVQYKSTNNICVSFIPSSYSDSSYLLNGKCMSDDDIEYMKHYFPHKGKDRPVVYRTISLKNINSITIDDEKYKIEMFNEDGLKVA